MELYFPIFHINFTTSRPLLIHKARHLVEVVIDTTRIRFSFIRQGEKKKRLPCTEYESNPQETKTLKNQNQVITS